MLSSHLSISLVAFVFGLIQSLCYLSLCMPLMYVSLSISRSWFLGGLLLCFVCLSSCLLCPFLSPPDCGLKSGTLSRLCTRACSSFLPFLGACGITLRRACLLLAFGWTSWEPCEASLFHFTSLRRGRSTGRGPAPRRPLPQLSGGRSFGVVVGCSPPFGVV